METRVEVGPVHSSMHGDLRLVVTLNEGRIRGVEPHAGFLHRGVEKLVERRTFMQSLPYMGRLDYAAPISYDELYVATVEKAFGVAVKERAQYVRVVQLELQRIASHLLWLGNSVNGISELADTPIRPFADREAVLGLLEEATGGRTSHVNMRVGGLNRELPPDFEKNTHRVLDHVERRVREYEKLLESNRAFLERMRGVGVLSKEQAVHLGVSGPVLRGSGVEYDVRKSLPYYAYEELHFKPQVESSGDCFARYRVRMDEIKESARMVRRVLQSIPGGDALGMPIGLVGPEPKLREIIVRRELPRGEGLMYMIADSQRPYRLSIRAPSFINVAAIQHLPIGHRLADLFTILTSLDVVMSEADR